MNLSVIPFSAALAAALYALWIVLEGTIHLLGWFQPQAADRKRAALGWLQLSFNASVLFGWLDVVWLRWTTLGAKESMLVCLGAALILLGLAIRIAARATLKQNFSAYVQTTQGHHLVTKGVYALVRHPAYTGFLGMLVGFPICLGSLGAFVIAIGLGLPALIQRIATEEAALVHWFGEDYRAYAERTKRLIPYMW